jgi:hypothetical protein
MSAARTFAEGIEWRLKGASLPWAFSNASVLLIAPVGTLRLLVGILLLPAFAVLILRLASIILIHEGFLRTRESELTARRLNEIFSASFLTPYLGSLLHIRRWV